MNSPNPCAGPLIWYSVAGDDGFTEQAAILECASCGYIVVSGNVHDERHAYAPMLREGLSA